MFRCVLWLLCAEESSNAADCGCSDCGCSDSRTSSNRSCSLPNPAGPGHMNSCSNFCGYSLPISAECFGISKVPRQRQMAGRTPKLSWNLQDTEGAASLRHPHLNLIDKHYWARMTPANPKGFCCVLTTLHEDHLPLDCHHHGVWAQSIQVSATHVGGAVLHYLLQVYGRIQLEPGQQIHNFHLLR